MKMKCPNQFVYLPLMYYEGRMRWFLLLFDKHFSNYLQIPLKFSDITLSICEEKKKKKKKEKYMVGADEDGRMLFLHNKIFLYIFKCKWNRETGLYRLTSFNLIT